MDSPVSPYFAPDYASARTLFLAAAQELGAAPQSHVLPGHTGASGEALAIDVVLLGNAAADSLVVVTSGVHGVEGFCGSGCQVALLHDAFMQQRLHDKGPALLLVHAVNPWGFSHLRLVNEEGIDLNRNFRDHAAARDPDGEFERIHPWVVPAQWPPTLDVQGELDSYIAQHGEREFQRVLMRGQTSLANGLFYAGVQPAWSNTVLRAVLAQFCAGRRQVAWIDLHTGLGPRGHGEKIYVGDDEHFARARSTWGADLVRLAHDGSVSQEVGGHAAGCLPEVCPHAVRLAMALEFGTVPLMDVVDAMRADQWLANHGADATAAQRRTLKRELRDAFYIDTDEWRAMAVAQARVAVLQALASPSSLSLA